jgi:hypothetical protein
VIASPHNETCQVCGQKDSFLFSFQKTTSSGFFAASPLDESLNVASPQGIRLRHARRQRLESLHSAFNFPPRSPPPQAVGESTPYSSPSVRAAYHPDSLTGHCPAALSGYHPGSLTGHCPAALSGHCPSNPRRICHAESVTYDLRL